MVLRKESREALQRLADGWVPMLPQFLLFRSLEKRGFVRADWGPDGTDKANKMCVYITDAGRKELA